MTPTAGCTPSEGPGPRCGAPRQRQRPLRIGAAAALRKQLLDQILGPDSTLYREDGSLDRSQAAREMAQAASSAAAGSASTFAARVLESSNLSA